MKKIDIWHSDCLDALPWLEANSVDAVVTDPPAGIAFMNKAWDSDKGGRDQWIKWLESIMLECKRVLKPGGHALVWAIPRTSHWTGTAIENAGFEVRDIITHHFGSGFPKSLNISKAIDKAAGAEREVIGLKDTKGRVKAEGWGMTDSSTENITAPSTAAAKQWEGWGTSLKPASEHWILSRKPLEKGLTVAQNVEKWGVGGLNIDASRIEGQVPSTIQGQSARQGEVYGADQRDQKVFNGHAQGRWPSNLILDETAAEMLGEPSRFFYCAKASKAERNRGLEGMPKRAAGVMDDDAYIWPKNGDGTPRNKKVELRANHHPTVKPIRLMEYLCKLICPPGGIILDPFMGSGSTGVAAKRLGFRFIGIEMNEEYVGIVRRRIANS